jgi:hypothetical protein
MDKIDLVFVKFLEGHKAKDPAVAGKQTGDTIVWDAVDGGLAIWKLGDTVFARSLKTGAVRCAPWSGVRWAEPKPAAEATQGRRA